MNKFYDCFPYGYYLDLSEPDLHILKRPDDSMVAAFFPEAAAKETLQRTAREDYRHQNGNSDDPDANGHRPPAIQAKQSEYS